MNIRKSAVSLCLALFMLLLLSACGGRPKAADSGEDNRQDAETYPSNTGTNKPNNSNQAPTEAEIQSVLDNGEVKVFWTVEEGVFSQSGGVSVYETETVNGDAVWNALLSQADLISRQQFDEFADMTITLDGTEYAGRLYHWGLIEFINLSEFPAALSPEHLMETLAGFTGTDLALDESDAAADTLTYYQFSVDGITIDRKGYSAGEDVYGGPIAMFSPSYVAISIPFCLGAKGDTLAASDFISSAQAEALCTVDLLAQAGSPTVVVFDHAELVYYYQAQRQMLLPAWRVYGTFYDLFSDGNVYSGTTTRLIDAQTGELFW